MSATRLEPNLAMWMLETAIESQHVASQMRSLPWAKECWSFRRGVPSERDNVYSGICRPLGISIDSVLVLWLQCTLAGTLSTFHEHPPSICAGGSLSSAPRCVPLDSLCERLCNLAQAEELNCDSVTDPQQVRFTIV